MVERQSHSKDQTRSEECSSEIRICLNRQMVDVDKAEPDFSIYNMDVTERQIRIPYLKALYEKKMYKLKRFQSGKDIWKSDRYGNAD